MHEVDGTGGFRHTADRTDQSPSKVLYIRLTGRAAPDVQQPVMCKNPLGSYT